jgi:undecaprenyl-diphosphatase
VQIYKKSPSVRLLILAVFVTLITGACGLTFKKYFEAAFGHLKVVAAMWAITGTVLLVTDARKRTRLGLRRFGFRQAAIVGLAQAVAIMPGISRSGATICAAILVGLHRRWAVEFSFLIAIPAILGATLLEVLNNSAVISAQNVTASVLVSGAAAAAICGVLALKVLIKASRDAKLKVFGFYCYILALAVLVYLWV